MEIRRQIEVSGVVQGVGFRPYIYRLASERHLAGSIRNTSSGVTIEIQGASEAVEDSLLRLPREAPPLARIIALNVLDLPCNGDQEFRILASRRGEAVHTLISPDVAICEDCLREMMDPNDRRYHYPFINCTNCGPRFTIVRDIPYDRPRTSMAVFPMCPACQAEYDDPLDRRFHAQPNACWDCGPRLELWTRKGELVSSDPIAAAAAALKAGLVVAVKGLGGFHLAADATNAAAVSLLRERKRRIEKPFAVMVPNLEVAGRLCELDDVACSVLRSSQRPIVLLRKKPSVAVVEAVAPFNRYLGVMLPYTPLHYLFFAEGGFTVLVMTSGNLSEEPIAIDNQEALTRLRGLADWFLMHNREILLRCDDSVMRVVSSKPRQMRRSRGFVPVPVFLREEVPSILAVGGELKNTICLTQGRQVFLSQHVGDLENLESYKFFEEAVEHLENILEIRPTAIAYDLHPDYFSTRWALNQKDLRCIGVQHHHAHIASCMAENELDGRVIGLVLDGTGYGTDGHIWGGEILLAGYEDFERAAHFEYVPLPGGAAAIHEPWRMAMSYLWQRFGPQLRDLPIPLLREIPDNQLDVVLRMTEHGINSPLTSSCGRLFDAVAALIGLRQKVNYEAQAAIELEMCRDESEPGSYQFQLVEEQEHFIIDPGPVVEAVVYDVLRGDPPGAISQRFHNTVIDMLADVCRRLRQRTGLDRVCLSGGTFQNSYLSTGLEERLRNNRFEVYSHSEVPTNDGGLSLGQAVVAAYRIRRDNWAGRL